MYNIKRTRVSAAHKKRHIDDQRKRLSGLRQEKLIQSRLENSDLESKCVSINHACSKFEAPYIDMMNQIYYVMVKLYNQYPDRRNQNSDRLRREIIMDAIFDMVRKFPFEANLSAFAEDLYLSTFRSKDDSAFISEMFRYLETEIQNIFNVVNKKYEGIQATLPLDKLGQIRWIGSLPRGISVETYIQATQINKKLIPESIDDIMRAPNSVQRFLIQSTNFVNQQTLDNYIEEARDVEYTDGELLQFLNNVREIKGIVPSNENLISRYNYMIENQIYEPDPIEFAATLGLNLADHTDLDALIEVMQGCAKYYQCQPMEKIAKYVMENTRGPREVQLAKEYETLVARMERMKRQPSLDESSIGSDDSDMETDF